MEGCDWMTTIITDPEDTLIESLFCNKCQRSFLPSVKKMEGTWDASQDKRLMGYLHVPDACPFSDCRCVNWNLSKTKLKNQIRKQKSLQMKIRQKEARLRGYSTLKEEYDGRHR